MEKLKPRTLSGFMELLPAPQQKFERMLEILRKNFALYGFTPIDTPIIESAEILLAKGGGETEKQIYRFQKGDSDLALRKSERARNCPFRKKERACNRLDYRLLMAERVGFEPTVP